MFPFKDWLDSGITDAVCRGFDRSQFDGSKSRSVGWTMSQSRNRRTSNWKNTSTGPEEANIRSPILRKFWVDKLYHCPFHIWSLMKDLHLSFQPHMFAHRNLQKKKNENKFCVRNRLPIPSKKNWFVWIRTRKCRLLRKATWRSRICWTFSTMICHVMSITSKRYTLKWRRNVKKKSRIKRHLEGVTYIELFFFFEIVE